MLDLYAPDKVEIEFSADGNVLWVNVDGLCSLRISRLKLSEVTIIDHREETVQMPRSLKQAQLMNLLSAKYLEQYK